MLSKRRLQYFWFVILLSCLGCMNSCSKSDKIQSSRLHQEIGADTFSTIVLAQSVSAYGINPSTPEFFLSPTQVKALQSILINDAHYIFDMRKKTIFLPSFAFKFHSEKRDVTVLVNLISYQIKFKDDDHSIIIDNDPSQELMNSFIENLKS